MDLRQFPWASLSKFEILEQREELYDILREEPVILTREPVIIRKDCLIIRAGLLIIRKKSIKTMIRPVRKHWLYFSE